MRKKGSHYQPKEAAEKLAPIISKAAIYYEVNLGGNVTDFDSSIVTGISNTLDTAGERRVLEKYSKDLFGKEFEDLFEEDDFNGSEYDEGLHFSRVYSFETKDGGVVIYEFQLPDFVASGEYVTVRSPQAEQVYAILNKSGDFDAIVAELKRMKVARKQSSKTLTLKKAALELKALADMLLKA